MLTVPSGSTGLPFLPSYFALYEIRPYPNERIAGLAEQLSLFADKSPAPEGLRYAAEFISPATRKGFDRTRRGTSAATISVRPI